MWETAGSFFFFFFFLCHFLIHFEESPVEKQCSSETALQSYCQSWVRAHCWADKGDGNHVIPASFENHHLTKKKKTICPDYSYTWEHLGSLGTQHFQFLCYWLSDVTQLGSIGQMRVQDLSEGNRALGTLSPVLHGALLSLHTQCSSSTHWICTSHPGWCYLQSFAAKNTNSSFSARRVKKYAYWDNISDLHNLSFSWLECQVAFLS